MQNNCINNGVTNGLKQKKEKKHATALYGKIKESKERREVNSCLERTHKTYLPFQL